MARGEREREKTLASGERRGVENSSMTTNALGAVDDGSRQGCLGRREEPSERVEEQRVRVEGAGSGEEKGGCQKSVEGTGLAREESKKPRFGVYICRLPDPDEKRKGPFGDQKNRARNLRSWSTEGESAPKNCLCG
jgi:hypothetical protein